MGPPGPTSPAPLLRQPTRFDTTNPPGDEGPCLEHVRGLFAAVAAAPGFGTEATGRVLRRCRG